LGDVPFAYAKVGERNALHFGGIDLEHATERPARGDNGESAVQKQQRRVGRPDDGQRQIERDVRIGRRLGSHGFPFLEPEARGAKAIPGSGLAREIWHLLLPAYHVFMLSISI
jgi:hypothetical protein